MFRHGNIVIAECNKPIGNKDGMDCRNRSTEAGATLNFAAEGSCQKVKQVHARTEHQAAVLVNVEGDGVLSG